MTERLEQILDEARVLFDLDAARAEVWVSGLVAEWIDTADLLRQLRECPTPSALAIARALEVFTPDARAVSTALVGAGISNPPWHDAVGTAVAQQAWEIVDPFSGNVSVVIEYEHADLVRHSMLVEIEDEAAVDIHFGPPGLVDAAFDESETRSLSVRDLAVEEAAHRVAAALDRTAALADADLTEEFVMNVALAGVRVGGPGETAHLEARVGMVSPSPTTRARDQEERQLDEAACTTLRAALAGALGAPAPRSELVEQADRIRRAITDGSSPDLEALVDEVGIVVTAQRDDALLITLAGAYVTPGALTAFPTAAREAIRGLEWADWLGAVIPLVSDGVGANADPTQLVRNINRCGEVTTKVPKRDIGAVADVFALTLHAWELTGVIDSDGHLTALGAWVLPRALLAAWGDVSVD